MEFFKNQKTKRLFVLTVLTILIGTMVYQQVENLSVIDAAYLSVITLTTVGYGDITPQTQIGKIFTIFYILIGLGILLAFINAITKSKFKRIMPKKNNK